jgi:hypothetical protein
MTFAVGFIAGTLTGAIVTFVGLFLWIWFHVNFTIPRAARCDPKGRKSQI